MEPWPNPSCDSVCQKEHRAKDRNACQSLPKSNQIKNYRLLFVCTSDQIHQSHVFLVIIHGFAEPKLLLVDEDIQPLLWAEHASKRLHT